jgi:hypothetical protein
VLEVGRLVDIAGSEMNDGVVALELDKVFSENDGDDDDDKDESEGITLLLLRLFSRLVDDSEEASDELASRSCQLWALLDSWNGSKWSTN